MPAKDIYHDLVKTALQKEGWTITHDPYRLSSGGTELFIDLGAEKLIAAEKEGTKIAVEIKSFLSASKISDFYNALGQFLTYRIGLEAEEPERILYLAIPKAVNDELFSLKLIETAVKQYQIRSIVYEIKTGVITKWL
ncbi:MAG: XisH family protein [Cyanobacteria bacterium J06643_13]